jgi:hypothetical protein
MLLVLRVVVLRVAALPRPFQPFYVKKMQFFSWVLQLFTRGVRL